MINYEDALRKILIRAKPRPGESVPLSEALGRTLARDVRALEPVPPFVKAAMDGYAVKAADTRMSAGGEATPLLVTEDLPAGRVSRKSLGPGQAVRIMTGAPLPKGADAVVMVEDTEKSGNRVLVRREVRRGTNIGKAGEDIERGELVLEKGTVVGPAEVGMLATLGQAKVSVSRPPRVAVISTGDEIVEPGEKKGPGRIMNSNGPSLTALAQLAGAKVTYLGIALDSTSSLKRKIQAARLEDVLVLSGGVSVGDYDLVKDELHSLGVRSVFWQVRIKPGKPVFFGVRGRQLVFGLPGNPTSAMVTFHLFVRPAIDRMLGRKAQGLRSGRAALCKGIELKPGRTQFLRGLLVGKGPELRVRPYPDQRSGVLRSMVRSRVFIVVPADVSRIERGSTVDVLFLD